MIPMIPIWDRSGICGMIYALLCPIKKENIDHIALWAVGAQQMTGLLTNGLIIINFTLPSNDINELFFVTVNLSKSDRRL